MLDKFGNQLEINEYVVFPYGKTYDCNNPLVIGKILEIIDKGIKVKIVIPDCQSSSAFDFLQKQKVKITWIKKNIYNKSEILNCFFLYKNQIPEQIYYLLNNC